MQTRQIEAAGQVAAVTQTLQDLGFTVREALADAGIVTGAKQREVGEMGQAAGQIRLDLACAVQRMERATFLAASQVN